MFFVCVFAQPIPADLCFGNIAHHISDVMEFRCLGSEIFRLNTQYNSIKNSCISSDWFLSIMKMINECILPYNVVNESVKSCATLVMLNNLRHDS